ncbi:MAG: NAD(P)H-quinone oxidoreductase [Alphaproteobacteria bacterium]|nr:NAD(P)H-quinone oxidoreductase [Alphaproteobacteria bacterium]MDE2337110.1 NAD(P)H-quinone oxidoreductase [Alphaproteobacteria bacterium]
MKCIEIRDKRLVVAERPVPQLKAGEVLVKVHAAGVNRPDILQRKGLYPPPKGASDIPGLEIAGEIVKGAGKGKKIVALVAGGGYAEYCAVPAKQCLPLPKNMDFITAAGIPETYFTVWTNLFDRGQLKKGETVLIHGGASGIGTTAIQIAKAFGAKVIVTAGTDKKCRACKKLGATHAINYKTKDFVAETLRLTKKAGVDVVLDMVGGDYLPRNLKLLKTGGRHVSIAVQGGRVAELDIPQVMSRRLVLTGSTLRPRSVADKAVIAKALHKAVWPLLNKGRLRPVIDKVFPLDAAQAAHDYLEAAAHVGKVILKVI